MKTAAGSAFGYSSGKDHPDEQTPDHVLEGFADDNDDVAKGIDHGCS
jgi:hypothetical protein